ncbi:cysteine proteinase [Basidiobolus meristosporus CBS 931.73]|uniref:Ubiquitin carboxyl-terminal hydrolase n=1 Tax=Basidiobolus meristosporus CBS 931.73 TaxID=1314790 RepID=A0A1Y1Z009_9FUNG|nr:cysteine proteinase [Basidiobolus meristosporus CBS 931.73]|eukprot:ORY03622.1 cysteine proteinase [Basidiobolus meristosporus CBS 931.73]
MSVGSLVTSYNIFHTPASGCAHLELCKNEVLEAYRILVRYVYRSRYREALSLAETGKKLHLELPVPMCTDCHFTTGRVHGCLHCSYLGCWNRSHLQVHLIDKDHIFAMDLNRFTVYCNNCNDYIYDLEFDRVHDEEKLSAYRIVAKYTEHRVDCPRYTEWRPNELEIAALRNQAQLRRCEGLRGLRNLGSTCFMNVIIQVFVHNPLLRAYYLCDKHDVTGCPKKPCLSCEMDKLFNELYSGKKEPYGPCTFLHCMWLSSTELAGYAQQDAHEFFISALNEIHTSAEGSKNHGCRCIIHQTFAGILQSDVTCQRCGNVTTAYDPVLDVSLDVKATARKKKSSKRDDVSYSLVDCLNRYTSPEKLGPREYSCSKCGNTFQEATKQLSFKALPPVLSIQLKRFEHTSSASKIESLIRIPYELDMTPFTPMGRNARNDRRLEPPLPSLKYKLFAVVNHEGKLDTGHYTVAIRHREEWFRFDDHMVKLAQPSDIVSNKAYMCFYIKDVLDYEPPYVEQEEAEKEEEVELKGSIGSAMVNDETDMELDFV